LEHLSVPYRISGLTRLKKLPGSKRSSLFGLFISEDVYKIDTWSTAIVISPVEGFQTSMPWVSLPPKVQEEENL
jgi:hypothetical protein